MNYERRLEEGIGALGLDVPKSAQQSLAAYLTLLSKWNKTYNLTAIREPARLVSHHILDSLSVLPHLKEARTLTDVGTGAGLPGIPIALARQDWEVELLESNHKKCAFLRQAIVELGIRNARVVADRAEKWTPTAPSEVVISRAFSDLPGFVEVACHLCRPGGTLAAMKGIYPDEELEQLPGNVQLEAVIPLHVPSMREARHLVLMRTSGTSEPQ